LESGEKSGSFFGGSPWYLTPWPYLGLVTVTLCVLFIAGKILPFVEVAVICILSIHILTVREAFQDGGEGTGIPALFIPIYALYWVFMNSGNTTLKILYGYAYLLGFAVLMLLFIRDTQ
jgi:hypothetical protein